MIELTFWEFHQQQYVENQFCLYVVKNGCGDILYIGISIHNIWERWFGYGGHMLWDGTIIYGQSPIGTKIENHLPESVYWKIQLWTLNDCVEYCKMELPEDITEVSIHDIEPLMIKKLSPALNVIYNIHPGKDTTPKSQKEIEHEKFLDEMYKKIFEKKT